MFGGAVGALATAATQSQAASPTAIAAAVQNVQDQSADHSLKVISNKLSGIEIVLDNQPTYGRSLGAISSDLTTTNAALGQIAGRVGTYGVPTLQSLLSTICDLEQQQTTSTATFCPSLPVTAGSRR